jgi:hypothetical protein
VSALVRTEGKQARYEVIVLKEGGKKVTDGYWSEGINMVGGGVGVVESGLDGTSTRKRRLVRTWRGRDLYASASNARAAAWRAGVEEGLAVTDTR